MQVHQSKKEGILGGKINKDEDSEVVEERRMPKEG